jgi:HEAT repeat protein
LLGEREASIRVLAARALGNIGGDKAKEALKQALMTEIDEDVIRAIELSLDTLSKNKSSK